MSVPIPVDRLVLFARQPILDASGEIRGHELLFRQPDGTAGPIEDGTRATAHVLVAAFTDVGIEVAGGENPVWVNVTRELIMDFDPLPMSPEHVVVELLEDIEFDATVVAKVRKLHHAGYRFALDDFTWFDGCEELLDIVQYVKLDVMALGLDGLREQIELVSGHDCRIVGEKVETQEERDACLEMGITLFQGYFFERPQLVSGKSAPASTIQRLQAVTSITGDAPFEEVQRAVTVDPGLGVRLLRYVNSAGAGLRTRVSSLRQALVLVGARTVRQWALLVMLTDIGRARPAVISSGLLRAKLCELIAADKGVDRDSAFAVGLLSMLEALLDVPLGEIIPTLPLTDDVLAALLEGEGRLGDVLAEAVDVQHGVAEPTFLHARYLADAMAWTDATLGELSKPARAA
jgi:EAL and modified HD-GYP domain-containing signal transduction protein